MLAIFRQCKRMAKKLIITCNFNILAIKSIFRIFSNCLPLFVKGMYAKKIKLTSTEKFDDLDYFLWVDHKFHIEI